MLLKKDGNGDYLPTTRRGTKTSFCILDSIRVAQIGIASPSFNTCNAHRQGLSSGWGDVYTAGLPEQWIDMGTSVPEDGDFAISSIADPTNKLRETDEDNNSAVTNFSIRGGLLTTSTSSPFCTLSPNNGPVGTPVNLQCEQLTPGEKLDLTWNSPSAPVLNTITVNDQGSASGSLVIPESTIGPHYVHATSQSTDRSTLALFTTNPAVKLNRSSGPVGSSVGITLTGFAAQERVTVRYTTTGSTTVALATLRVNADGSAAGTGTIPSSAFGAHKVEGKGGTSKKPVTSSFSVVPRLSLNLTTVAAGKKLAPTLRGFKKSETVTISIPSMNLVLKSIRVSSSGSANGTSSNSFLIPKDLEPGDYVIQALGASSGASATVTVGVVPRTSTRSIRAADTGEPTATATVPSATLTRTATPEPTETPTEPTPTEKPTATVAIEPSATATTESSPTDGGSDGAETTSIDGIPGA